MNFNRHTAWLRWVWTGMMTIGFAGSLAAQQAPSGEVTMGVRFGDQDVESFGDVLIPMYASRAGLLFVNPRGAWNDDDGREFNFGAGYRHLLPGDNALVGGNLFYDRRNTELDRTFNQAGFGLEFLGRWVDARANYYLPEDGAKAADDYVASTARVEERGSAWASPTAADHQIFQSGYSYADTYEVTTLHHLRQYERAREGYDCEIGALLPIPVVREVMDVKAFVGYYAFDANYGADLRGVKSRLEVRALPSVYLDAEWFEDEELYGSSYAVGVRVRVPFSLANIGRGRNPFEGALDGFKPGRAAPSAASRMTDGVIRDLHVRTDVSEIEEVVQDRRVTDKTLVAQAMTPHVQVLAANVSFVDDDNRSGVENGSWEHPYRRIDAGVSNAVGGMVYVCDANAPYLENVRLTEGLTLWGSGALMAGRAAMAFGSGIDPVVNGRNLGPVITLANGNTVAGLEIIQSGLRDVPHGLAASGNSYDISRAGIHGDHVTDIEIRQNYIHNTGDGILLTGSEMPDFRAILADNRSVDNDGNGVQINVEGDGAAALFVAISGDYSRNGHSGVDCQATDFDFAEVVLADTTANRNGMSGLSLDVDGYDGASLVIHDLIANGNGWGDGLDRSSCDGLRVNVYSYDGLAMAVLGGTIQANGNFGNGINAGVSGWDGATLRIGGAETSSNGFALSGGEAEGVLAADVSLGNGILADVYSDYGDSRLEMSSIISGDNSANGVRAGVYSYDREASAALSNVVAGRNGLDGVSVMVFRGDQVGHFENLGSRVDGPLRVEPDP